MGIFTDAAIKQGVIKAPASADSSSGGLFKDALAKSQAPKQDLQSTLNAGDTGYFSGLQSRTASEQVAGAEKIASSVTTGAQDLNKGIATAKQGGIKNIAKGFLKGEQGLAEGAFGTITGAARSALAPLTATVAPVISGSAKVGIDLIRVSHPQIAQAFDKLAPKVQEAVAPKLQDFAQKHPNATGLMGDILNTALLAVGGGEAEAPVKEALTKDALAGTKEAITKAPGEIKGAIKGKLADVAETKKTAKIQEAISPKPTVKEAKLAQKQGRLVKGREPSIFRSGTEDTINPSKETLRATETIKRLIPDADKLNSTELYTKLDETVEKTAENLKPELQKVKIEPKTVEKINSDWSEVKKSQIKNADASDMANVKKRQANFETFLQKSKSDNINDLWEARKEYDSSIPENVKNANQMSPENLQNKRSEWLENRAVLNDAINESDVGTASKQAFQDMNDMYNAKEGILSKSKVEGAKPSKMMQAYDSKTGKRIRGVLKTGAAIYAGDTLLKRTTGLGF